MRFALGLVLSGGLVACAAVPEDTEDAAPVALSQALASGDRVLLNELLANEPGSDVKGEFVELVNVGAQSVSLAGATLSVGGTVRHTFASGTSLAPGAALVVFGGASAIPAGLSAVAASTGTLALSNSGSTVALGAGSVVADSVTYTSALSGSDGVSMNRSPDATEGASFVLHTRLSAATSSPGTHVDGTAFADDGGEPPTEPPVGGSGRLRVVAANLTSGTAQSYDPGHGVRILDGLDPDIALVQEMNYGANGAADLRAFVDAAFGSEFVYARQAGVNIPSGVVSRYPIVASGVWDDSTLTDRDHFYARIDVPGARDLWAVSVHFPSSSATKRSQSASDLVAKIRSVIPAGDYLVLGGDLNTDGRGEACVTTLSSVVDTSGPYPADQDGVTSTNAARKKPYDWVLADADLEARATATVLGNLQFASGLVFDSRVFSPLSAVSPVRVGDSGATNMQHMAVVRDFVLPN